ncbi:type II toxin-antitoxin system VapC family toxin [Deferrisoma palaeochoriense]
MSLPLCVDASFVVRLVVPGEESETVASLWRRWAEEARTVIAPGLIFYEVTNALYRYERAGFLTATETQQALDMLTELGLRFVDDHALHQEALLLARELSLPAACDAHYLAAARRCGAEFWTADKRLARQVANRFDFIRVVRG